MRATYNGATIFTGSTEAFEAAKSALLQELDVDENDIEIVFNASELRATLREKIAAQVGDTPSLLGTISDGAGILVALAFADIVALNDNTTFAAYRTAKLDAYTALANGADIAALATSALAKIQNGDAKLTASVKGLENVINETLARSTAVAEILTPPVESA